MSVSLRAPDGGFFIESASPETQFIDGTHSISATFSGDLNFTASSSSVISQDVSTETKVITNVAVSATPPAPC